MKIKIQVVVESEHGERQIVQEVTQINRDCLQPENLGLSLAEAKTLLKNTQQVLVKQQIAEYEKQHSSCQQCTKKLRHKDKRTIIYRTLFGKLKLKCNRLFHCTCNPQQTRSFNPIAKLLPERTSPELLYLESKWASLMSYGLSSKILQEVLPIEGQINATSIRNNLQALGKRLESELPEEKGILIEGCQRDWDKLPRPDLPIVIGMDGGYVRFYDRKSSESGHFQVLAGKSIKADGTSKCFGMVYCYDTKPQRRVFEVLRSQGMQMNQQVTFLSDGEESIRDLQYYLNPNAEHILDWFHITMRITVMTQIAKGITKEDLETGITSEFLQEKLNRLKWSLWHGNVFKALGKIEDLIDSGSALASDDYDRQPSLEAQKLCSHLEEFETYISNNGEYIPNYGERYHNGEVISSSFVESAVNQVISKRFVKKQQMRWTPEGAHLLIQVRAQVLNQEWSSKFRQWYPGLTVNSIEERPVLHAA
ncbi:MAG: ISKra4 family transposase [Prochloraceae cyanobacterium]|nr:ISKra4 family transposase [Prochloraceae cyanobacterium]